MTKFRKFAVIAMMLGLVQGCVKTPIHSTDSQSSITPQIHSNNALFVMPEVVIPDRSSLFQLTSQQQRAFHQFYQLNLERGIKPHHIVAEYLSIKLSNFAYNGATYTAAEAMSKGIGNCLSLAILTTAYARLVNLEVAYREVNTVPVFSRTDSLLLSSRHVQTLLFDPTFVAEPDTVYFTRPHVVVDYFPERSNISGRFVSGEEFIAMYYLNRASEFMLVQDLDSAFQYVTEAYKAAPNVPQVLNFQGLLHRYRGDDQTAEAFYQTGLQNNPDSLSLVSNYIVLLRQQDRNSEAEKWQKKLMQMDDPNPYQWLEQAWIAHRNQELRKAILLYKKTLSLAPYVPDAYQGLYEVYLSRNQTKAASQVLRDALDWMQTPEQKTRYKRKLYQLENL